MLEQFYSILKYLPEIVKFLPQPIAKLSCSHPNDIKLLKEIYDDLVESDVELFYKESVGSFLHYSFIANKVDILITHFEHKSFLFANDKYKKQLNTFIHDLDKFYFSLANYRDYKSNIDNATALHKYTDDNRKLRIKGYESFCKLYKTCLKNIKND